ncbi:MAG: universal stress protein [Balneolaceae bacterium]
MIRFKKILVPTDFSKNAEAAYTSAQKITDVFGGRVDFLHVVPTIKYLNESLKTMGVPLDMDEDVYPKIFKESEQKLEQAMDQFLKDENRGNHKVIIDRKPSETISKYASSNDYDLIVMGAKGKHESSMMRGSTTEKVIRKSKVPVFSIEGDLDEKNIKNIVMPTDGSALSFTAFPMAVALADTFNANLTLFHVMELYGSSSAVVKPNEGELNSVYRNLIERLNTFLDSQSIELIHIHPSGVVFEDSVTITDGDDSRSVQLHTKIVRGVSAHYEIENYASEEADLLIMATHGHSGFAHLILGSTAEKVAQYVNKPVITVRPDKELFENK